MTKNTLQIVVAISLLGGLVRGASAQDSPPTWKAATTYRAGDVVYFGGNTFRSLVNQTTLHPGVYNYAYWELYDAESTVPLTLNVGTSQLFPSIQVVWRYIKGARIEQGSSVTIHIVSQNSAYVETFNSSFSLNHPFGSSISIKGDITASTQLNFTATGDGFTLDSNHTFGSIQGVTINGPGSNSNGASFHASTGGNLMNISATTIENFSTGLQADLRGEISGGSGLVIQQFEGSGASSQSNAVINFNTPITLNGALSQTTPAVGFVAGNGGMIGADGCTVSNCQFGFISDQRGFISANHSTVNAGSVGQYGYLARWNGTIIANSANAAGSFSAFGYAAASAAYIRAVGATGGPMNSSGLGGSLPGAIETTY